MTDIASPGPDPAAPPPPVPSAAEHPGANPSQPHGGVAPYATAQQPYPGAPPVWTPAPVPRAPASSVMAGTALALAIVGALIAFVPFAGALFAWLLLIPAVVLAIASLVRRAPGRGASIAAIVVSGVAAVVSVAWGVGLAFFGSLFGWSSGDSAPDPDVDEYSSSPSLGVEAGVGGASRDEALTFGTEVSIVDENTGDAVWSMTVRRPEDATTVAAESLQVPPLNGAYLAVPMELTNVGGETIDLSVQYGYSPYTWLLTGDGGRAESTYLSETDVYPLLSEATPVAPGETVVYYDVYDVAASVADTGYLVADLDSGTQIFWGP